MEQIKENHNFKYGIISNPSRDTSLSLIAQKLLEETDVDGLLEPPIIGKELNVSTNDREFIIPLENVAGLTVGDLRDYPFFTEKDRSYKKTPEEPYMFFIMYDTITITQSVQVRLRYIGAIDWRYHKDEMVDEAIEKHLKRAYGKLNESNKNRTAYLIESDPCDAKKYRKARESVNNRNNKNSSQGD